MDQDQPTEISGRVQSIQVRAPHFCAGIFIEAGRCIAAGPALAWTLGKPIGELNTYFKRHGWHTTVRVAPPPSSEPEQEPDEDEEEDTDMTISSNVPTLDKARVEDLTRPEIEIALRELGRLNGSTPPGLRIEFRGHRFWSAVVWDGVDGHLGQPCVEATKPTPARTRTRRMPTSASRVCAVLASFGFSNGAAALAGS